MRRVVDIRSLGLLADPPATGSVTRYGTSRLAGMATLLALGLAAACSTSVDSGNPDGSQIADPLDEGYDECAERDWYGDGQCDTFCNDADSTDCATNDGGEVVCALFIEESNGYCSRRPDDPCISQDPDCASDDPGSTPPSGGDDPIVCPAIAEEPDGVCSRPASDPCRSIDPDCGPADPGNSGSEPGNPGQGGGSGAATPTEPVACTLLIEESDGACKREPTDPCIFQDPDCNVN